MGRTTRRDLITGISGGVLLAFLAGRLSAATIAGTASTNKRSFSYLDIPNAEDLAPIKGTRWLITSGTAQPATAPAWDNSNKKRVYKRGGIYVIDRTTRSYECIWPDKGESIQRDPRFTDCDAPPNAATFVCSGLHLVQGQGGVHRLYAVHNGERHSIEIFEVKEMEKSLALTWVGALLVPHPCTPNSVAVRADGSLFVTSMAMLDDPDSFLKIRSGQDTGYVLQWHPTTGWKKLEGSDGSGPNGLLASPDGATLYYALAGSKKIIVQSLQGNAGHREVALQHFPDNLRWDDHGMIWVGGNTDLDTFQPKICKLDPHMLVPEYIDLPSAPDKYARCSVAVEIDREIWLGSFGCERMAILSDKA